MRFRQWLERQWERQDAVGAFSRGFDIKGRHLPRGKRWRPYINNRYEDWVQVLRDGRSEELMPALNQAWREYSGSTPATCE